MATRKASSKGEGIEIRKVETRTVEMFIVGKSPMVCNSMNNHVMQQLLAPPAPKNRADRASNLKHDVIAEYRRSMYLDHTNGETLIVMPSTAFKGAMMSAALDVPGTSKAQIGRLTWVEGQNVSIYGVPQLICSVVRNSDINHTPDVRSRAILPTWAARLQVTYVSPILKHQDIFNLMQSAGVTVGVGDWRQEKGKGNYGQWQLVNADDSEYASIVANGGREAQLAAYDLPGTHNQDTEELLEWYFEDVEARGFKPTRMKEVA